MRSILFILFFSLSFQIARSQDLTAEQTGFLKTIVGEWKIRKAYMEGDPLKGRLTSNTVRISEGQLLFLSESRAQDTPFIFTKVETKAKKIEMMLELDNKIHRYILHMDGDLMWLVMRIPGNADLPENMKPTKGNFCMALTKAKSLDESK